MPGKIDPQQFSASAGRMFAFRKADNNGAAFHRLDQTGAQIGIKAMRQPVAGCPGHGGDTVLSD